MRLLSGRVPAGSGQLTVPVRYDHQVKCVLGVLSMGNDSPHMYRVRTIENEMKPWEILEKMQF